MLKTDNALLIVIDIQGNLYRAMDDRALLLENTRKLIQGAAILGVPVLVTEQVRIGPTIPEIMELLPGAAPIVKASFSCWGNEAFRAAVEGPNRRQLILCGIESHVCVYQTAVDLLAATYEVHLVADAVSSRTARNREMGIQKLTGLGAVLTGTEMALFELLGTATHGKAKDIFRIIK